MNSSQTRTGLRAAPRAITFPTSSEWKRLQPLFIPSSSLAVLLSIVLATPSATNGEALKKERIIPKPFRSTLELGSIEEVVGSKA